LKADPFAKGVKNHSAPYLSTLQPIPWSDLKIGQKFSRNESGCNVYMKVSNVRGYGLDNEDSLDIPPNDGKHLMVYMVVSMNTSV
jgi:hypothetical protein